MSEQSNGSLRIDVDDALIERIASRVAARLTAPEPSPPAPRPPEGKLAVSVAEAAEALGMSVDHFRRRVMPDLRIVRSGRLRLVPISELEDWLQRNAARALAGAPLAHGAESPHGKRDRQYEQGTDPGADSEDRA